MDTGIPFFDIILLAMIAGFLILRLRGVLGRRDGHDGSGYRDPFRGADGSERPSDNRADDRTDNVVTLPGRDRRPQDDEDDDLLDIEEEPKPAPTDPLGKGLAAIRSADPSFDGKSFGEGARMAFEIILNAFAGGDRATLKSLLAPDVFANFEAAINDREEQGHVLEETLVGIKKADLVEADLDDGTAYLTMKFVSEQITVIRDAEGNVVDGDPNRVTTVTDFWTFARDVKARDPNWTLVATGSLD